MARMKCGYCGAEFEARPHAIYCHVNCRNAAFRRGQANKPNRLDKPPPEPPKPVPLKKRRCDYCGHWHQPKMREQRFCCVTCRVYWSRHRKGKQPAAGRRRK